MTFSHFPRKPVSHANGASFRRVAVVPLLKPGSGKGSMMETGRLGFLTHFEMSRWLKAEATIDTELEKEMKTQGANGKLVSPKYPIRAAKKYFRSSQRHVLADGMLRQPEELELIPVLTRSGYRVIVIFAEISDETCHKRMLKRGRPEELDDKVRHNRLNEFRTKTMLAYQRMYEAGTVDLFNLGDISQATPDGLADEFLGIVTAYGVT